jgi:hypothetical protein
VSLGAEYSAALQLDGSRARWLLAWRDDAAGAVDGREVKPPDGVRSRLRIAELEVAFLFLKRAVDQIPLYTELNNSIKPTSVNLRGSPHSKGEGMSPK